MIFGLPPANPPRRATDLICAAGLTALVVLSVLACGSEAAAARISGLSDQNMAAWDTAALHVFERSDLSQVRYITAWDVALHRNDAPCEVPCQRYAELNAWITKAESHYKRVLISFGDRVGCDGCQPPTPEQYEAGVSAFLSAFPQLREFTAWNEPNHKRHVPPALAASYWSLLNSRCHALAGESCIVAAGDLNDAGDFRNYSAEYLAALEELGADPTVWSIHPYGAVDSGDFAAMLDWVNNFTQQRAVWFTEVGALYCSPSRGLLGVDDRHALEYQSLRAATLNALLRRVPSRVERTYYYFLAKPAGQQEACPGFDSALLGAGDLRRPALTILLPAATGEPGVLDCSSYLLCWDARDAQRYRLTT